MAVTTIHVRQVYVDAEGHPCTGRVTLQRSVPLRDPVNNTTYENTRATDYLDVTGSIDIEVIATNSDDIDPTTGVFYNVFEEIDGSPRCRSFPIEVPKASPMGELWLADVAPAIPGPPVYTYALKSELDQHTNSMHGGNIGIAVPKRLGRASAHGGTNFTSDSAHVHGGRTFVDVQDEFGLDPTGLTPCDTAFDNAKTAFAASGATFDFAQSPSGARGVYRFDNPSIFQDVLHGYRVTGPGSRSTGLMAAQILHKGTGPVFKVLGGNGVEVDHVGINYDNPSFTTPIIETGPGGGGGDATHVDIHHCGIGGVGTVRTAVSAIRWVNAIISSITYCTIYNVIRGIERGAAGYANVIEIGNVDFVLGTIVECDIYEPLESWHIHDCTAEGLVSGEICFIKQAPASPVYAWSPGIDNNWIGDGVNGSVGKDLKFLSGGITDNFVQIDGLGGIGWQFQPGSEAPYVGHNRMSVYLPLKYDQYVFSGGVDSNSLASSRPAGPVDAGAGSLATGASNLVGAFYFLGNQPLANIIYPNDA